MFSINKNRTVIDIKIIILLFIVAFSLSLNGQEQSEFNLSDKYFREVEKKIEIFELKKNDKVCDFGTGTSNTMYLISCYIDSLEITLQDIDSSILNKITVDKKIKAFSSVSENIYKSQFKSVIGEEKNTKLPDNLFDKIIMIEVLHHIPDANKLLILKSLSKSLNENGILILGETLRTFADRKCLGDHLLSDKEISNYIKESGYKVISTDFEKGKKIDLKYYKLSK